MLFVNIRDERIYLPTSLCHEASLPANFTKDTRKMQDIDKYKIKNPVERFDRIQQLTDRLANAPDLQKFKLQVNKRMSQVQSEVLKPPNLICDNSARKYEDYTRFKF